MASLYVAEYTAVGRQSGTGVPVPFVGNGPVAQQKITIAAGSNPGVAFSANTKIVRIHTDSICSFKFGPAASVSAANTDARMAANQTEYYAVQANGTLTVAVITNT